MVLSMPGVNASPSAELDTLSVLLLNLVQTPPASKRCSHCPSVNSVSNFNQRLLPVPTSAFHRLLPAVEHRAHQTCLKSNHVRSAAWQVVKLPPMMTPGTDKRITGRHLTKRLHPHSLRITIRPLCMGKWTCTVIGYARPDCEAGAVCVKPQCCHETGESDKHSN